MFKKSVINNAIYDLIGDDWYAADASPFAMLRAEGKTKNPWVAQEIEATSGPGKKRILDIGCGAGFLSNFLATKGHLVSGIDASAPSLDLAKRMDCTASVEYTHADAYSLPYSSGQFDVVCAMDFLEHVAQPERVVAEASRVLKPGGTFFFHTFSRNWLSYFVVIKLMEWFIPATPKNLHVYHLFIKPKELREMCRRHGLETVKEVGLGPNLFSRAALKILFSRRVPADFSFQIGRSLAIGFLGYARKI